MKKNKVILIVVIVVFVMLIAGAAALYNHLGKEVETDNMAVSDEAAKSDNEKDPAPDFTVIDAGGNEVKLSDFRGKKPVVVNFWASWCAPCQSEMPDFEAAYNEYKDEIEFLMVNMTDGSRETIETAKTFIEESGYTFPVYFDTDSEAALTYEVYSIPVTYFIAKDGSISARATSAISDTVLQRGIDLIK